jgi:hypothetical protein
LCDSSHCSDFLVSAIFVSIIEWMIAELVRDNCEVESPAADFDLSIIVWLNDDYARHNSGDELPAADFDLVCFCMGVISLY